MDNINFDGKFVKNGDEVKNHEQQFNEWSIKYNELYDKLDKIFNKDKQLDERFNKFWKFRDDLNDQYMKISKQLEDSDKGISRLSAEEREELDKNLDKMYEKLEKVNKIIDKITEANKLNDPFEVLSEITSMEDDLRN